MKGIPKDTMDWLLDSDPALVWQVERDLLKAPERIWRSTRERVSREGFGARLLSHQDPDGQWAGGAFFPKDFEETTADSEDSQHQPWTATTWSLNSLREWGVEAGVLGGTAELIEKNSYWEYDNLPYWGGEVDCCINGYTLANGAWLGADVSQLLDWFTEHQLDDGGWNCEWINGSVRSSFHSTLNSLKGLLAYQIFTGISTKELRQRGEEYLLERGLFRRKSTGETVAPWAFRFAYPFRWYYNVLNSADYFREKSLADKTNPDPRMSDAINQIRLQQQPDGSWIQASRHPGRVWFQIDGDQGEPSKWLTLIGQRVLHFWDGAGVMG